MSCGFSDSEVMSALLQVMLMGGKQKQVEGEKNGDSKNRKLSRV